MTIYFDENKNAYGFEIPNAIATVDDVTWQKYAGTDKWDIVDGVFVDITDTEEYKEKQELIEKERVARLFLTGADVERGIYQAIGMDFEDIINMVNTLQPEGLDVKALKIELKANNFYRGNPYVDAVGTLLGFTKEMLDKFFTDGNYKHLSTGMEEEYE